MNLNKFLKKDKSECLYGDCFFQIKTNHPGFSITNNKQSNLILNVYFFLLNLLKLKSLSN